MRDFDKFRFQMEFNRFVETNFVFSERSIIKWFYRFYKMKRLKFKIPQIVEETGKKFLDSDSFDPLYQNYLSVCEKLNHSLCVKY